jgi:2-hydroxychromene-2-carboxylate isomerase
MSLKSRIAPHVASYLLGAPRLERHRAKAERRRLSAGEPHIVEVFHDPADPYSQLLMQVLPDFEARYHVAIRTHVIGPPAENAVPERELLQAYARKDAEGLAREAGINFTYANAALAENTAEADARQKALGHYQGGMIYYAGEWYWGIDRLHYLEDRLQSLGARKNTGEEGHIFSPPKVPRGTLKTSPKNSVDLHWYFSFRSPYSAISFDRISALAKNYGANLKLRFVLPMVMRGLPVPSQKKRYIPRDTAREARRLGVAFGKVCDPVGSPVERGYAVLAWAISQDRGLEFAHCFFEYVWAKGVEAGSNKGLRKIVEASGLDWAGAELALQNEDWRITAETNRTEMMSLGIWGVPSFRVGEEIVWGQDRLWVVEGALSSQTK